MISVLRVTRPPALITAAVYEELFGRELGSVFSVRYAPLVEWWEALLGRAGAPISLDRAARAFREATRDVDFVCPSYECIPLAPILLALRNRSEARVRLLFIAHAAGAYAFEWTLLRPLLVTGDVIIAPSESARATIEHLAPAISAFVRVIPHPIAPLAGVSVRRDRANGMARGGSIVSLGRIHAGKLLHRGIEALDVLRARHRVLPTLGIAGAIAEGGWSGTPPYVRSLQEKVRRLGLSSQVRFVGPIRAPAEKARFLAEADALMNLSITIEESFPKAPVEALGVGTPVLGTAWNGLRDTVGRAGYLVPVGGNGVGESTVHVTAEAVADGMEQLLDSPPSPEACRSQVEAFRPEVILPQYVAALTDAQAAASSSVGTPWPADDEPASATGGLLGATTVLAQWSWRELFEELLDESTSMRREWTEPNPARMGRPDRVRAVVQEALRIPLQRFCAGRSTDVPTPTPSAGLVRHRPEAPGHRSSGARQDRRARFLDAARAPGLIGGRIASLVVLLHLDCLEAVAGVLREMEAAGERGPAVSELGAEVAARRGDLAAAFALCEASLRRAPAAEAEPQRVRRIARIARQWGQPLRALPWLDGWLARFPDSQESGAVWLECGVTAARASGAAIEGDADRLIEQAAAALGRARALLGDLPSLDKADQLVSHRRAARAALAMTV